MLAEQMLPDLVVNYRQEALYRQLSDWGFGGKTVAGRLLVKNMSGPAARMKTDFAKQGVPDPVERTRAEMTRWAAPIADEAAREYALTKALEDAQEAAAKLLDDRATIAEWAKPGWASCVVTCTPAKHQAMLDGGSGASLGPHEKDVVLTRQQTGELQEPDYRPVLLPGDEDGTSAATALAKWIEEDGSAEAAQESPDPVEEFQPLLYGPRSQVVYDQILRFCWMQGGTSIHLDKFHDKHSREDARQDTARTITLQLIQAIEDGKYEEQGKGWGWLKTWYGFKLHELQREERVLNNALPLSALPGEVERKEVDEDLDGPRIAKRKYYADDQGVDECVLATQKTWLTTQGDLDKVVSTTTPSARDRWFTPAMDKALQGFKDGYPDPITGEWKYADPDNLSQVAEMLAMPASTWESRRQAIVIKNPTVLARRKKR